MIHDVLVIGAGAAGLTAAYDLFWDDYKVKVLEAANSVGGRLKKNGEFTDFPLDLGAEWIHVNPNVLEEIVNDPSYPVKVDTYSDRQQYATYNDNTGELWDTETVNQNDYRFKNYTWYDFFNEYIADDLVDTIDFGCQVREISWRTSPVVATCSNGDVHKAWHAIVTVPVGVLARGDITFTPRLPRKTRRAMATAGSPANFPNGIKTWLKFSKKFWNDAPSFAFESDFTDKGERMFYDASFRQGSKELILGVYNQGTTTNALEGKSDRQIVQTYLNDLTKIFGSVVRESYTGQSVVQNWKKEPYAKGSFSMYHSGYRTAIRDLRKSLANKKLWFAGEAIPRGDWEWGFAHGAARSGRGAASGIRSIYGDARRLEIDEETLSDSHASEIWAEHNRRVRRRGNVTSALGC